MQIQTERARSLPPITVTPSYGTEGFAHTVYNGSSTSGYVTLFNCRGYGIYTYNPIEHQANDSASQDEYGIISESITQKYKNDLAYGTLYVDMVLDDEKDPRTVVKRVFLNGNKDEDILCAFIQLEVGDLIRVTEDKSNIDSYYFIIQGVSYQTRPGGILMFDWILKPFLCLALGMSQVAVEFSGGSATDSVTFGSVPHIANLSKEHLAHGFTWKHTVLGLFDMIFALSNTSGGNVLIYLTSSKLLFYNLLR